jgi:hypothetical protein
VDSTFEVRIVVQFLSFESVARFMRVTCNGAVVPGAHIVVLGAPVPNNVEVEARVTFTPTSTFTPGSTITVRLDRNMIDSPSMDEMLLPETHFQIAPLQQVTLTVRFTGRAQNPPEVSSPHACSLARTLGDVR